MREIKFNRVFFLDEEMKQFSHKHQWGVNIKHSQFTNPSTNNFTKSFIDCQFIGLKDKNGVDIYERDLLSNPKKEVGTVVWFNSGFHLECERRNKSIFYMPLDNGMLRNKEIIGNIYENENLLKCIK